MGRDDDAGPAQHRLPVDELGLPGLAEPRAPLGGARLELEQVAAERPLEPGERLLDALGGCLQRRAGAAGRRRLGLAARPALEQPAERERLVLERRELRDQPRSPSPGSAAWPAIAVGPAGRLTSPPRPAGSSAAAGCGRRRAGRSRRAGAPGSA